MAEVRGQMTGVRSQKTEIRGQITEGREQRAESAGRGKRPSFFNICQKCGFKKGGLQ